MDLQKEREEFEAWHYERYLIENPNIDITHAKYIYDYAHKNALVGQLKESHFTAWQAAITQAIPDGFVVVPEEPTEKMINAGVEETSVDWKRLVFGYKAMVEAAQENKG